MKFSMAFQAVAAMMMLACALVTVHGIRNPRLIVLDETREIALLSDVETGREAEYERCKALLINLGAIIAKTWPMEKPERARDYLRGWVLDEDMFKTLWDYRGKLATALKHPPDKILLRTDQDRKIQIFRTHRAGMVASVTYTLIDSEGLALCHFSFDVQLTPVRATLANPMGFAVKRWKPIDQFWEAL